MKEERQITTRQLRRLESAMLQYIADSEEGLVLERTFFRDRLRYDHQFLAWVEEVHSCDQQWVHRQVPAGRYRIVAVYGDNRHVDVDCEVGLIIDKEDLPAGPEVIHLRIYRTTVSIGADKRHLDKLTSIYHEGWQSAGACYIDITDHG